MCWLVAIALWVSLKRGSLQRLVSDAGMGTWMNDVRAADLLPFCGYFSLFAVFDIFIQGMAARAFGTEIPWTALAAKIPVLYLAISIPSLGNFGTREITWANLFVDYGTREELTAFALWTNFIFLLMHLLIGAIFVSRAITLVRELRSARRAGAQVLAPLFRDPIDP